MNSNMITPSISLLSLSLLVAPGCSNDNQPSDSGLKVEVLCGGASCSAFVRNATPNVLREPQALAEVRSKVAAFRNISDDRLVAREIDGGIIISITPPKSSR